MSGRGVFLPSETPLLPLPIEVRSDYWLPAILSLLADSLADLKEGRAARGSCRLE